MYRLAALRRFLAGPTGQADIYCCPKRPANSHVKHQKIFNWPTRPGSYLLLSQRASKRYVILVGSTIQLACTENVPDTNYVLTVALKSFLCPGRFQNAPTITAMSRTVGDLKDAIPDVKDAIWDGRRHLVYNDFFVAILYVGDVPDTSLTGPLGKCLVSLLT